MAGLLVSLPAAELALRVLRPRLPTGAFYRLDPITGWSHVPNAEGWYVGGGTGEYDPVRIRINSRGLRDREIPYAREDRTVRILTLGDSFTAAMQVPVEQTFQRLLEQDLNRCDATRRYEVINTGVNGWATDNELLFYHDEGARYRSDVVLLIFHTNDVAGNYEPLQSQLAGTRWDKPHFLLEGAGLTLLNFPYRPSTAEWLAWEAKLWLPDSRLYRVVSRAREVWRAAPSRRVDAGLWEEAWAVTGALLRELRKAVTAHGASLAVAVAPLPEAVDPRYWDQVKGVRKEPDVWADRVENESRAVELLERDGFPAVPLLPAFRRSFEATGQPLHFYIDRHLNPEGHRVMADALRASLIHAPLLPPEAADAHRTCA